MYAKIIEDNLFYSSENMELVINDKLCGVCNPLESDLLDNGYKHIRVEHVESKEKYFEELENEIVVFEQIFKMPEPSVYDLFDDGQAATDFNKVFIYRISDYRIDKGYIATLLRNKTFESFILLKWYLRSLFNDGVITVQEKAQCYQILLSQNIDLDDLQK